MMKNIVVLEASLFAASAKPAPVLRGITGGRAAQGIPLFDDAKPMMEADACEDYANEIVN